MSVKLISRREPFITLNAFRFKNRQYKEGQLLDRRRVQMTHRKLAFLIAGEFVQLASEMDPEKLKKYGYEYDLQLRGRLKPAGDGPLERVETPKLNPDQQDFLKGFEGWEDKENADDEPVETKTDVTSENTDPADETTEAVIEVVDSQKNGWYNVVKDGKIVNDKLLRKRPAKVLARDLRKENK